MSDISFEDSRRIQQAFATLFENSNLDTGNHPIYYGGLFNGQFYFIDQTSGTAFIMEGRKTDTGSVSVSGLLSLIHQEKERKNKEAQDSEKWKAA